MIDIVGEVFARGVFLLRDTFGLDCSSWERLCVWSLLFDRDYGVFLLKETFGLESSFRETFGVFLLRETFGLESFFFERVFWSLPLEGDFWFGVFFFERDFLAWRLLFERDYGIVPLRETFGLESFS